MITIIVSVIASIIGFALGRFSAMHSNTTVQIQHVNGDNMKASQTIIAKNTNGNITMTSETKKLK